MLVDCHVHLDDVRLSGFLQSYGAGASNILRIFSNSVDIESSIKNLELARTHFSIECFVGIHPEVFARGGEQLRHEEFIEEVTLELTKLSQGASGIGEAGLDPKYGQMNLQRILFQKQLQIAESNDRLSVTIHSRDTLDEILDILSNFSLGNEILFHWFSGTEKQLQKVNDNGYFVSFGLPSLYSKRVSKLLKLAHPDLLLAETDSPIMIESVSHEMLTPFAIGSVLFAMSSSVGVTLEDMIARNERNAQMFLKRKAD